jgi:Nitrile hydratase, alpha chain
MTDATAPTRRDFEARLVARASSDAGFRGRLRTDPRAAVAEETGMTVPESVNLQVLEETPQQAYIVIPVDRAAISDDELDAASGGNSPWDPR